MDKCVEEMLAMLTFNNTEVLKLKLGAKTPKNIISVCIFPCVTVADLEIFRGGFTFHPTSAQL